uniref:Ribosome biogenesis protein BOP1 homolog n=1 Tax=Chlamydomonas leiostraca TaxID=1034604 RepID=A0A7S0RRE2_9CHLO|mmetsp:Transcript_28549/g.72640  ORF Transcript_28549/g.72640 Transcript_28549/m.72640 type:complete len:756 (+) Transcript_28549:82-2349(+)|eukprot:CAMPEP_0202879916 /NCGR_PEP_ID=MMETSP1391-20130828/34282_1 /ASSEMBLY_ACC=CAM_ASM_000867 /TAXON_ID=1034604 /ORGANISM="Chlamydomonas leiostraca, Strain SAG 11-49" /LENGTH=755 /DNA_ID=CAMNT_0049562329 /DNA_START=39 /DNA_END=2306 /DNA_ORIENTATION=+
MPPRATGKRGKQPPPLEESDGSEEEPLELVPDGDELQLDDDSDEDAVVTSGSEEEGDEEGPSGDEDDEEEEGDGEVREAMLDYMATAERARRDEDLAAARREGGESEEEDEEEGRPEDPGSDSSEDEREQRNTIGDVPLEWYKDEDHIGYDKEGLKLIKSQRKDKLDALLDRNDSRKAMRTIYDEYNDEEITLTKEELRMIMAIRKGHFPSVEVNPYEPYVDWFTREREVMPINDAPIPKRRFIPSKHEEAKIVKLVRAIRKGWLKTSEQKEKAKEPEVYLLWGDDGQAGEGSAKTGVGLSYIPPAKPKLPGHAESYNPPKEYIPTEEEVAGYELMDPEDRPKIVPRAYNSLREVPMYPNFIKDMFERCLDLYLCPRVRKKRMFIDPETLVPKLPKPQDLQPFPTSLAITYEGHAGKVRCVAPDASGQWLASGSDDGTLRVWEVASGRCMATHNLGTPVHSVAWCPAPGVRLLSAAAGNRVFIMAPAIGTQELREASEQALSQALEAAQGSGCAGASGAAPADGQLASWSGSGSKGVEIMHRFNVKYVTWHARGDYFASVAPTGNTQAVLVHQLSKGVSQAPFRKNKGRVTRVLFHPTKPFFFVAAGNHVRVYNLAKQALAKKLMGGSGQASCLAVHPSGDHVLVGSDDKRLAWYDLDLSDKPYKALRYHSAALRGAAFHRTYPLFASAADDGTAHVFHGMVYSDLVTNPLLVPLKVLRGHTITDYEGVTDCAWHPTQPWLFTAGADGTCCLYCN